MPASKTLSYIQGTKSPYKYIIWAGLLAGSLDALAATVTYVIRTRQSPVRLFQFIASGVFGPQAFTGGYFMALWGMIFHFIIAFSFTLIFFFVYPKVPLLWKNKYLTGLAYGMVVWLVMNLVVVPLSNTPGMTIQLPQVIIGIVILMVMIGLPIAVIVHSYYFGK